MLPWLPLPKPKGGTALVPNLPARSIYSIFTAHQAPYSELGLTLKPLPFQLAVSEVYNYFRAVSEQFQSFRAFLEFQSSSRAVLEFQSSFRVVSEFYSSFRAVLEQF